MAACARGGLAAAVGRGAGALAYRRQELLVVALLAASVLGGFALEAWHRRTPTPLDRLEAEPPRLAELARVPGAARRTARPAAPDRPARAEPPAARGTHHRPARAEPAPATPERPLDLNRASPGDLQQLPGIGPRLAARIVAQRQALGGRFPRIEDLASVPGLGPRKADRLRALVRVTPGPGDPTERLVAEPDVRSAAAPPTPATEPP
jgi:DNA uptake protein ComE-like DNA-binding protein